MQKNILLLALISCFGLTTAFGQSFNIIENGGANTQIALSDIQKITFPGGTQIDIETIAGPVSSYDIDDILSLIHI